MTWLEAAALDMTTVSEIETYLAGLPEDREGALRQVISLIKAVAPDAAETMRYRMPTYELPGGMLCAVASQKHHMSLYIDPKVVSAHRHELVGLNLGKGCIRFRRLEQLPLNTVRLMLEEVVGREQQHRNGMERET